MWRAGVAPITPVGARPEARRLGFLLAARMRVGLYGGSFDPAHAGHAHVAGTARRRLGLDLVIWLVAPQNPLKARLTRDRSEDRVAGAKRWARGPAMVVSDIESRLGARYTLDTVRWFKRRYPGVRFVWIMGADGLAELHRWKGWTSLMREIPIAVVSRPGLAVEVRLAPAARRFARGRLASAFALGLAGRAPPAWTYLTAPFKPVSSTALRNSA